MIFDIILINGSTQYSLLLSSSSSQISLGVSRGQPLAAAPAFLGGDPTVARGAPPVHGMADSPDVRPRSMAVTHLDEAGGPFYIY